METNTRTSFEKKANNSFRWTAVSEIIGKLIVPIMNMVLARLIAPSIFGIVASISIITSFAQSLTESGFAKYLLTTNFIDEKSYRKACGTSLISTFFFSTLLFAVIVLFRNPIATFVDCDGYGLYLLIASIGIPFYGVASIQIAIFRRTFRFKQLSFVRIASSIVTFGVEIGMAAFGLGIWGLILGTVVGALFQVVFLLIFEKFKLVLDFSFKTLRESIVSSSLYMIEVLLTWLNTSLDIFLLTKAFDSTVTGVYKNAFSTEKGIVAVAGAIFTPVLLSLLSKFSNDEKQFESISLKYQKVIAILTAPMCLGMFMYRQTLSYVFFGSGWDGADLVIGAFALTDIFKAPLSDFCSNIFLSKGKPQYSIYAQIGFCIAIAICCIFANQIGFVNFVVLRSCCTAVLVLLSMVFVFRCKVSPKKMLLNMIFPLSASLIMFLFGNMFQLMNGSLTWDLVSIAFCAVIYFAFYFFIDRGGLASFWSVLRNRSSSDDTPISDTIASKENVSFHETVFSDSCSFGTDKPFSHEFSFGCSHLPFEKRCLFRALSFDNTSIISGSFSIGDFSMTANGSGGKSAIVLNIFVQRKLNIVAVFLVPKNSADTRSLLQKNLFNKIKSRFFSSATIGDIFDVLSRFGCSYVCVDMNDESNLKHRLTIGEESKKHANDFSSFFLDPKENGSKRTIKKFVIDV